MIDVELAQVVLVDAKLHLWLSVSDSPLHLMPSVVLKLGVFNFQSDVEERLDVPVVDDVKKDGDGSEDPEDRSNGDDGVGPECETIMTLWWW